jgi:tol-pal system protein YbgF
MLYLAAMIRPIARASAALALAGALTAATAAAGQDRNSPWFLDRMFSRGDRSAPAPEDTTGQIGQPATPDQVVRIERLEAQIRQMTGTIEQLQFRNRQLEAQLQRMEGGGGSAPVVPPVASQASQPPVQSGPAPTPPAPVAGRRSDVFDPAMSPNAPGAPRTLGTLAGIPDEPPPVISADPPVGAPGGRSLGAPLDLSTLASNTRSDPASYPVAGTALPPVSGTALPPPVSGTLLPPPPSRNPSGTGAVAAVAPPSDTPRDQYDLGYGYILRKDYALAESTFRTFLAKYPNDRQAGDAQFWVGESLFQRQRYDAAAQAFLDLSTKQAQHAKAPEALLRLGQSLAALGQKEMSCATLAEVGRKYPRASASVKQGVEREQKRVRC